MKPVTPIAIFFARWLPIGLLPLAMILCYGFFILTIGLTIGTEPPNLMYIDVRDN